VCVCESECGVCVGVYVLVCVLVCVCVYVYLIVVKKPPRGRLGPSCAVATQTEQCSACPVHGTVLVCRTVTL